MKFAAWNTESRLSDYAHGQKRGSAAQIVQGIEQLNADVIVLPEAYIDRASPEADESLRELGYTWHDIEAGPSRDWTKEFLGKPISLRVLSRLAITHVEQPYVGEHNVLAVHVVDPETKAIVRAIAVHLDDRSEAHRLRQVEDIIPYVNQEDVPTVMLGDFNTMWHKGRARAIGAWPVRKLVQVLPNATLRDVGARFTDMATGDVLNKLINETDLRDADPSYRPTVTPKRRGMEMLPSAPLAQIDHILVSDDLWVDNFKVAADSGSDHRAISADIGLKDR